MKKNDSKSLPIIQKMQWLMLFDFFSIYLSLSFIYLLLFHRIPFLVNNYWWLVSFSLILRLGTFWFFGLYRWIWKYASVRELFSLIKAIVVSSFIMAFVIAAGGLSPIDLYKVMFFDALNCFVLIGGGRLLLRVLQEKKTNARSEIVQKNVLVVGAGDAGEMIVREMLKSLHIGYKPVGFVDDNLSKVGEYIHKLPILGTISEIPGIVEKYAIEEIIIAIPSATGKEIRRIVNNCEKSKVPFKIVPGVYELLDGTVHVNQIRSVDIEDLLGREPVFVDIREVASYLESTVLVTGAGGSIGSELCRQVAMFQPQELVIFGRGENSIFHIEYELRKAFPYLNLRVLIGDVRDASRVNDVFEKCRPKVVFHAAAHKHVYLMEANPSEAILNNVVGTQNLIYAADKYAVETLVNISTDKAVNPKSVMGASKRLAEMLVQAKALSGSKTKFVSVRFGNVLESRGSVVPLFKKQIADGGPITVTHPEAQRYFMTIPEAVQLVIQAGAMGVGGEIFILDMGEPIKILDLARDLIKLSGLELGRDIDIEFIGLKPGEKLFEEILTTAEGTQATRNKKIFIAHPEQINLDKLQRDVDALRKLAINNQTEAIKLQIKEAVS